MAELNSSPEKASGKRSAKKLSPRVDLTAMVDLAFLLVTFFMLTTTLSKTKAMDVTMPDDEPIDMPVPASRTLSLCLGKSNQVLCYLGQIEHPIKMAVVGFNKDGLRKMIVETAAEIRKSSGKDMIIIVKPSQHSVYDNLVNTMDELNITNNTRYAIADIAPKDIDVLKQRNAF